MISIIGLIIVIVCCVIIKTRDSEVRRNNALKAVVVYGTLLGIFLLITGIVIMFIV